MLKKICKYIESFPKDKLLHLFICYIIADITINIIEHYNINLYLTSIITFVVGFNIGVIKECYDKHQIDNTFDCKDWLATILGCVFKIIINLI